MELVKRVYMIANQLPKDETYGLSLQVKRAAVSIPSNIAEGQRRKNRKEFVQFLYIAYGSLAEIETQLILIQDLYKISVDECYGPINEIERMLQGLIVKLKSLSITPLKTKN